MNWYKLAEAALNITPKEFQAMSFNNKVALAQNRSISPQTQQLFFTEKYWDKNEIIWDLAENTSISPQTQLLFITQEYSGKIVALQYLALNPSITPEIQKLFFTQEYEGKQLVLKNLSDNPSFLKDFTLQEMREIAKTKEARLPVYRKRFKDVKAMVLL